jgi:hypothetical protein
VAELGDVILVAGALWTWVIMVWVVVYVILVALGAKR